MSKKPNIVIIMTDQQQARAAKREGFTLDTSPFIDRCASEGTWFDKAYTPAPLCAPARISMLTGRYTNAHGVRANPAFAQASFDKDLIDVLKEAGYKTAMIGKNHSHLTKDRLDHWFSMGHPGGYNNHDIAWSDEEKAFDQWIFDLSHGVAEEAAPFPLACQGSYRMVSDAEKWISEADKDKSDKQDKPFFLWLSFAEPHNPYQVPEPYFSLFPIKDNPPVYGAEQSPAEKGFKWDFLYQLEHRAMPRYDELLPRMRSNYYGMIRLIDDQIERFTKVLKEKDLYEDTIFFFVSDHGDFAGDYGFMRKGPEMPESLMRIPFAVWGSGIQTCGAPHKAHVNLVDIMPTLCDMLDISIPAGVQGKSLRPILSGEPYPEEEFSCAYAEQGIGGLDYNWNDNPDFEKHSPYNITFDCLNQYSQCGTMRMVRKDDWKLVFDMQGNGWMYNLHEDPAELCNLYNLPEFSETQNNLLQELLKQTLRAQDSLPLGGNKYELKRHPKNYWSET